MQTGVLLSRGQTYSYLTSFIHTKTRFQMEAISSMEMGYSCASVNMLNVIMYFYPGL